MAIRFSQIYKTVQKLPTDEFLFLRGVMDGETYIFRIERQIDYIPTYDEDDGYDEKSLYVVRMTKRNIPVAYMHHFNTIDETEGFIVQFDDLDLIAREKKSSLKEMLNFVV